MVDEKYNSGNLEINYNAIGRSIPLTATERKNLVEEPTMEIRPIVDKYRLLRKKALDSKVRL